MLVEEQCEPGAPAILANRLGREAGRLLLHQQEEIVLRADVAVQRHRRVAETGGDRGHRDGTQPLGIRELDRGLDDLLDGHLALRTPLRVCGDAPGERDAARQLEVCVIRHRIHPTLHLFHLRTVYYVNSLLWS